ncbi:hypothetical protein BDB00DRAFT_849762 [Zychaea mexicana]|uniref:uncharacterized protein n=1 Tax=Zychaea mexicana TaxID=64656 RepID=UPI0022FEE97F|nr:uncharacterized protein BDB00DRAFT_849762 [Zychaea mexicana]KAI9488127.1 hypothetical protein BDB00DRAFT_849762 [Zychaea mexicana]
MLLGSFATALILSASCAAAERLLHAAVLAPNGTIYIIGGTPVTNTTSLTVTTLQIDAHHEMIQSPLPQSQQQQQQQQQQQHLLQGHTAHWHPLKNEPMTLFGMTQQHKENQERIATTITTAPIPVPRYHHASSLNVENNEIYVVGGRDFHGQVLKDIWKLSLRSMKWHRLYQLEHHRGFAGHGMVLYRRWLISCFGDEGDGATTITGCTLCFDTHSLVAQACSNHGDSLPLARTDTGLSQVQDNVVIVHGGRQQQQQGFLGDIWHLDLAQTPNLVWTQIESNLPPRAGHSLISLNDSTLLLYGGQYDDNQPAPIEYIHLTGSTKLATTTNNLLSKRAVADGEQQKGNQTATNKQQGQESQEGLNGGSVAGIVIGVCAFLAIAIGVLVWTRKQQRRRLRYFHNRASRFSLSTPPPSRPTSTRMVKTASLPEMSHIQPAASRLSTLSFGSDFRMPVQQDPQRASISSIAMPQSRFDTRTDSFMAGEGDIQIPEPVAMTTTAQQRRRESSTSFKRLTLNIPSALRSAAATPNRDETAPSPSILKRYTVSGLAERRRSSMFGLRASRFLHIPGNSTNDASTAASSISNEPISRMSMDARSVSSIQWVGFNDSMDYREQQWNPTVQLAVTNQQRRSVSSSRPTSFAAESIGSSSSPRSAVFRLSNSTQPYRLSTQEIHSWDDQINQRVLRTRVQQSSSSSLPSRAIERFNNYRISTSSDESSIVVASGTAAARQQ